MSASPVFKLIPTTQKYDWGKIGLSSTVAQLASAADSSDFSLDESAPYAELWMGTHPSGPSRLLTSTPLSKHLSSNPSLIGDSILSRFPTSQSGNLPFLLKVLSIGKALSIQTHPAKREAEKLHAERPDIYKDSNHKPEMAIALTPFTALCGFLPLPQIVLYLNSTPEFAALIPPPIRSNFLALASVSSAETTSEQKSALQALFTSLMTAPPLLIQDQLSVLLRRYAEKTVSEGEEPIVDLVIKLDQQFPGGDVGVFCAFVLNYVKLEKGEAIFLGAGEPHAYVSGDIIECMANSDNVIRAGLTPKLRDIPTLIQNLTYNSSPPSFHLVKPSTPPQTTHTTLYAPPPAIPDFKVLHIDVPAGEKESGNMLEGPSVAIVVGGAGKVVWKEGESDLEVKKGDVFFVGAGTRVLYTATGEEDLGIYRAFVETD